MNIPQKKIHPIILTILDGWGYSETIQGNAVKLANTPEIDKILKKYPKSLLSASGEDVGLPKNQFGNSEVGHTIIGAGRIIEQELVRINNSIKTKEFTNNKVIHNICKEIKKRKTKLHIIGLCSDGGVHSHINHLRAIIQIINNYYIHIETCLHLITDGRDTEAKVATKFINIVNNDIKENNNISICTISGRYYSMDRDCRWSRTEKAYKILTEDEDNLINFNYQNVIESYYNQDISDEFIPPTKIKNSSIKNNDGLIFFNFRPDRIRQLVQCFTKENFKGFNVKKIENLLCVTLTEYDSNIKLPCVFPPQKHNNFLGEIISKQKFKQLRIAETEKYAHVTYFFNGGTEEPFPGEDRELIPSPKVETYDLKPAMSAYQLTENIIKAINKETYKLIIVNYANPDMVGHTGKIEETIEAIKVVDTCIGKLFNKTQEVDGIMIITADHGNAEYMIDHNNKPCKSHSSNLVPFILIENNKKISKKLKSKGTIADIAPTILEILNIQIPIEMSGKSLRITNHKKTLTQ